MTDAVILIQINQSPDASFEKPLLSYIKGASPAVVTFDFDNYSEETIRQYAVDLVSQSQSVAIVVQCKAEKGPFTGLVQFFNRIQQLKHPQLLVLKHGFLPPQLEKMMKIIGGNKYSEVDTKHSKKEVGDKIISFLQSP